jgi:hypothetical protein
MPLEFSFLPVNIAHYSSLAKTLKLTPPELMKKFGLESNKIVNR